MRLAVLLTLTALLAVGPALAQEARAPRNVMTRIVASPSPADIAAAFPAKAKAQGVPGRAMLDCDVSAAFGLENCKVRSETPEGMGFGAAAVKLAELYRLDPVDYWGRPVLAGDHRYFGVIFPVEGKESPQAPAGLPIGPAPGARPSPPPIGMSKVTHPNWSRKPTGGEIAAVYPQGANNNGGRATIDCRVTETGGLAACAVVSEAPADEGFGAAAVSLAPRYRMQTTDADGNPVVGASVRIPVVFQGGSRLELLAFPDWLVRPTVEALTEAFPPEEALHSGAGRVTMTCTVTVDDGLKACKAQEQNSPGRGYGTAAMQLSAGLKVARRPGLDSPHAGARISFDLVFNAN